MKKALLALAAVACLVTGFWYYRTPAPASMAGSAPGRGPGAFSRVPLTVELVPAARGAMNEVIAVVGSLEGAAAVEVASKVSGRLLDVSVRIGDRVARNQKLAQVEDREIHEQVRQAEAAFDVGRATVRQREADLAFAVTNLDRTTSLFKRQLLPQQTLDDAAARHQSAQAQIDLARAQFAQAQARLEELKITLSNAEVRSPVDGFVGRRLLDPGAFVSPNTPLLAVVDISVVRLVANLVERDLRRVHVGTAAEVEVDAFPGDVFHGRVARVAPVLDPSTRTSQMEIEVPNADYRLKPGMYTRVRLTVSTKANALTVPVNSLVNIDGRKGVFTVADGQPRTAHFNPVDVGLADGARVEIVGGIADGTRVVTAGASGLRHGDPVQLAGDRGGAARPPGR